MPIYRKESIISIHIPKTAGLPILEHFGDKSEPYYETFPDIAEYAYIHYTYNDIKKFCKKTETYIEGFKIFAIVRNPYDRIVSDFHYFIEKKWISSMNPKYIINFTDFVEFYILGMHTDKIKLENEVVKRYMFDNHKTPQHKFVINEENCVAPEITIIRFENLKEELKNKMNIDLNVHINKTTRNKWESYYNKHLEKLVYNYYFDDFEIFKYDKLII